MWILYYIYTYIISTIIINIIIISSSMGAPARKATRPTGGAGSADPYMRVCMYIYIYIYIHTCRYIYIYIVCSSAPCEVFRSSRYMS